MRSGWGYKIVQSALILRILLSGVLGVLAYEGAATWLVPQINSAQNIIYIPSPAGNVLVGGIVALVVVFLILYIFGVGVKFAAPVQNFGGGNRKRA